MKEESVFWLGGKPGTQQAAAAPPQAGQLEPVVRAACRARGVQPGEFVAALGGYGSWLVSFEHAGRAARLVWDGRASRLILQGALRSGGWEDLAGCPLASADEPGLAAALATLLDAARRG